MYTQTPSTHLLIDSLIYSPIYPPKITHNATPPDVSFLTLYGPASFALPTYILKTKVIDFVVSLLPYYNSKNKLLTQDVTEFSRKISLASDKLESATALTEDLNKNIDLSICDISNQLQKVENLKNTDYTTMNDKDKLTLHRVVSNIYSLAPLVNVVIK